ncbi:MAG: MraY family glycosyltransferase [Paracoccaceae bacterium]|jgi:UDP-N-acetylmuramyl pentapeptide phosphotransferase/UDP-N-acetylglucosamine-1-phosphate transferase|nr:MraY family glycosyltransferase [Paracoccaceae bacterium]MDP7184677.1 MraY family glycosyltransferase [Paracoccaceae bacterium]
MWHSEFSEHLPQTFGLVFFVALAICSLVVIFKREINTHLRADDDLSATQAMHAVPTPRLGGIAIFAGIASTIALSGWSPLERMGTVLYLATLSPLFIAGILEDLGIPVSPRLRLGASILAGILTAFVWGFWVKSVGIWGIDAVLGFAPLAIAFTILAASGATNAFNLIDGLNGLLGFYSITAALALSIMSAQVGAHVLQAVYWMTIFAVLGFLVLNFPFGKLFLGDAGAYLLGHTLVWSAIALTNMAPQISPFAILLVFFWPIADTLLAIWRRLHSGRPTDQPDRLHFHQLALRMIEIRWLGRNNRRLSNPITTLALIPLFVAPQIAGVLLMTSNNAAMLASALFAVLFISAYRIGMKSAGKMARRKR